MYTLGYKIAGYDGMNFFLIKKMKGHQ